MADFSPNNAQFVFYRPPRSGSDSVSRNKGTYNPFNQSICQGLHRTVRNRLFYIVGHSMGGTVAADVALQCHKKQKNCMGLILLSVVGLRPHKGFRNSYPKIVYSLTKNLLIGYFIPSSKAFVQMGFPKRD